MNWLDLAPGLASLARGVDRIDRFDHDPFVSSIKNLYLETLRCVSVAGDNRVDHVGTDNLAQLIQSRRQRLVDQVHSVAVQDVEEPHVQRNTSRIASGAKRRRGVLEHFGGVFGYADQFPVEHQRVRWHGSREGDHIGEPFGDVVEIAGVERHLIAGLVHLKPDPIELCLNDDLAELADRFGHAWRGSCQHRLHAPPDAEANSLQRLRPARQRKRRGLAEIARQHRRPTDRGLFDSGGLGDARGHHPVERPLTQATAKNRRQKVCLHRSRSLEEVIEYLRAPGLGTRTGSSHELGQCRIDLVDAECRRVGSRVGGVANRRPTHTDPTLTNLAGQEADHNGGERRAAFGDNACERVGLLGTARSSRNVGCGLGHRDEGQINHRPT